MSPITSMFALLLPLTMPAAPATGTLEDEGFVSLVEGTDPSQFDLVGIDSETLSISEDGEIAVSGTPNGYFATKESFDNYTLRFDWMYERPEDLEDDSTFKGNSGLLVHIEGEAKVWPKCVEVQLMNADAGRLLGVSGGKIESKQPAENAQPGPDEGDQAGRSVERDGSGLPGWRDRRHLERQRDRHRRRRSSGGRADRLAVRGDAVAISKPDDPSPRLILLRPPVWSCWAGPEVSFFPRGWESLVFFSDRGAWAGTIDQGASIWGITPA